MYCLLLLLFAIVESIFCLLDLVGAKLTAYGATTIHLLHGKYSGSSSPQVLHDSLTSPSAFLSSSSGYTNSTALSLPLNFALQPGWLSSQVLFILDSHHLQLYLPHSWETPLRRSQLNRLPYPQLSGLP